VTNYQITKPLGALPPLRIKFLKITTNTLIDFVRQFNAIAVRIEIHNHAGGTASYKVNEEADTIDIRANTGIETLDNVQIEKIEFPAVSDVDLVVSLAPIPMLKRYNALEVG
jgi:hypothetical protein